jgi:adenylyltransferase/sulfurtransferase
VLVVGLGGLGCPALLGLGPALVARGGRLTLVDDDCVDVSNLHRQILYRTADVGRPKAEAAREALDRRFPGLGVEASRLRLGPDNASDLVRGHDVVLDGTDGFSSKFLLNDACVAARVPLVHAGVVGLGGQLMSVVPGCACFRCLFEAPPPEGSAPSCAEAGVLGAVAGVVGARMAREALAILDGQPRLAGALEIYDARRRTERRVQIRPRPGCAACGNVSQSGEPSGARRGASFEAVPRRMPAQ